MRADELVLRDTILAGLPPSLLPSPFPILVTAVWLGQEGRWGGGRGKKKGGRETKKNVSANSSMKHLKIIILKCFLGIPETWPFNSSRGNRKI